MACSGKAADSANALRYFHSHFEEYNSSLSIWKMQLLDEQHLLLKYGCVDHAGSRGVDSTGMLAFFVVYNFVDPQVSVPIARESSVTVAPRRVCGPIRRDALARMSPTRLARFLHPHAQPPPLSVVRSSTCLRITKRTSSLFTRTARTTFASPPLTRLCR